jgi:hypothetical protein
LFQDREHFSDERRGGELRLIQTQLLLRIIDVGIGNRALEQGVGLVAQVALKGPSARAEGLTPGNLLIYGISEREFKAGANHRSVLV